MRGMAWEREGVKEGGDKRGGTRDPPQRHGHSDLPASTKRHHLPSNSDELINGLSHQQD